MLFGAHVSIAGGIWNAPANAAAIGCEVFQVFVRSPRGGQPEPITNEQARLFQDECKKHEQAEWYVHAPYYINFASKKSRIRKSSIRAVREDLERASQIGAKYLMTHLGSFKDMGQKRGMKKVKEGLAEMLDTYQSSTKFLIEISAGAGEIIGDTFEELEEIIDSKELKKYNIGICFDTQHAFASGYDLRTKNAIDKTLKQFDKTIGLERLKMSHCNDSKVELGAKRDRHEHIGDGLIGKKGFEITINHPKLRKINFVLETKGDKVEKDLKILKKLRK